MHGQCNKILNHESEKMDPMKKGYVVMYNYTVPS